MKEHKQHVTIDHIKYAGKAVGYAVRNVPPVMTSN